MAAPRIGKELLGADKMVRSYIDALGRIAWIFDEKTHPLGNQRPKMVVLKPAIQEPIPVIKPVVIVKKHK